MSLQILSQDGSKYDPVFLKILEDIPGGVTVKTNRFPTATTEIKKGALLNASASSVGLYNLIKTAKVKKAFTTLACWSLSVYPQHEFVAGDYIGLPGKGSSVTIASIVKGVGTDLIVLVADFLSTCATSTILRECGAAVTTGAAVKYSADAFLRNTIQIRKDGVTTLLDNIFAGAVVRGTVDLSELPYFVTAADKTALTARIRFA